MRVQNERSKGSQYNRREMSILYTLEMTSEREEREVVVEMIERAEVVKESR